MKQKKQIRKNSKIRLIKSMTITIIITFLMVGTVFASLQYNVIENVKHVSVHDIDISNEQIKIYYTDQAVGIGSYNNDTCEPNGWELFPSLYWDSNGDTLFEDEESIATALFPAVHFTESGQDYSFNPMHQSIMQQPGNAEIVSSGWISEPNVYASEVKDINELITLKSTITIYNSNNYFTQKIDLTSTTLSTITDVTLITYFGIDIQGFFDDYTYIDHSNNNMIKSKDNASGVWFGAYPDISAYIYEVSNWDDGPSENEDLWQHCLKNTLNGQETSCGDVEGALLFNLDQLNPGENKSITMYYSFANSEEDLYPQSPPPDIVYVDDDYYSGGYNDGHSWGYDAFDNIQDGINKVEENGYVNVYDGIYDENIVVDKTIGLIGEDKTSTIIQGDTTNNIVTILADYVNVSEFTITNGGLYNGIYLDQVDNVYINNTILTYCENGILFDASSYNIITDNNASHNNDDGVDLWHNSNYNTIQNNILFDNAAGTFINNSIDNLIDNNKISDSNAFGIQLYNNANNNIISNNSITHTTDELIPGVSGHGINLWESSYYNTIIYNNISENIYGAYIRQTSDTNKIYYNNFVENTQNAYDNCNNIWDNGYPKGGNYWDNFDEESEGAYDDFRGENQDIVGYDGIVDNGTIAGGGINPYNILPSGSNKDHYPYIHPIGTQYGFILNLVDFPMYEAESPYNEFAGPAVTQMNLDYMWWNSTENPDGPPTYCENQGWTQQWLYDHGLENNSNLSLSYLDATGIHHLIQNLDPPYSDYGYNFGIYHNTDHEYMLSQICLWINYSAGIKPGHPKHVPGAVPVYGDYSNWLSVRGIHTDQPAYPLPDQLEVRGFWVNDPYPGGIGENSYKMVSQWLNSYYLPIDVEDDPYDGEYVAICEPPPSEDCDIILKQSTKYWDLEPEEQKDKDSSQITPQVSDKTVIYAAQQGVIEQLIPYDDDFAEIYERTIPGKPIQIKNLVEDKHDYYAVPFNSILTLNSQKIPGHSQHNNQNTLVVVLIDATNGRFKEASWVHTPEDYLPIKRSDALGVVFDWLIDHGINPDELNIREIKTKLVYRGKSPYHPDWRVTINEIGMEFFVNQKGLLIQ